MRLTLLLAVLAACTPERGAEPASTADAGDAGDAGEDAGALPGPGDDFAPEPPEPPEQPRFVAVPCPPGWEHVVPDRGACQPPEGPDWDPCPPDGVFPDEAAVRERAPGYDGPVVWVQPGAPTGGDGSREAPLRRLTHALPFDARGIVALSVGRHQATDLVLEDVALVGACAGGTVLHRPGPERWAVLLGDGSRLAHATIEAPWGLATQGEATASLDTVAVAHCSGCLRVGGGAEVEGRRLLIEDCTQAGVAVLPGGLLVASDLVVRRQRGDLGGVFVEGGTARLTRVLVSSVEAKGLFVSTLGDVGPASLTVDDVHVTGVTPETPERRAFGVMVQGSQGSVTGRRLRVDHIEGYALCATSHARLELEDVEVEDVRSVPTPPGRTPVFGLALAVASSSRASLTRARLERSTYSAVNTWGFPGDEPAEVVLTDVLVRGVRIGLDGLPGSAVFIAPPTHATLTRVAIAESVGTGVEVRAPAEASGTSVTLTDVRIWGLQASELDLAGGAGLVLGDDATVTAIRLDIDDVVTCGLCAGTSSSGATTTLEGSDVRVGNVRNHPGTVRDGAGIVAWGGAQVALEDLLVEDTRQGGVVAVGTGQSPETRLNMARVVIRNVRPAECAELPADDPYTCMSGGRHEGGGYGLAAVVDARVTIPDFLVQGAESAGLLVAFDGLLTARRGRVTGNGIGINLMVPDYDLDRLSDEVYVFGNDVDSAREDLLLPQFAGAMRGVSQ